MATKINKNISMGIVEDNFCQIIVNARIIVVVEIWIHISCDCYLSRLCK